MEKTRPKVLLVDDDRMYARRLSVQLEEEFDVTYIREAAEAKEFAGNAQSIDGILLDIVMPPPEGLDAETHDGYLTGVWLLSQLKRKVAEDSIAVVVITNHNDFDRVCGLIDRLQIAPVLISVENKKTSLKSLVEVIRTRVFAAIRNRNH